MERKELSNNNRGTEIVKTGEKKQNRGEKALGAREKSGRGEKTGKEGTH